MVDPAGFRLRDGREVLIRHIRPSDEEELRAFVRRLSPESRRLRFFGPIHDLPQQMAYRLSHVDGHERAAVVATLPGDDAIRGVARYDRIDDSTVEGAFTVEDSMQGQGLGTELLWRLAEWAQGHGYRRLRAFVLPENRAMLDMFQHCGIPCSIRREPGQVKVDLELGEGMVQPRFGQG